jgi:hypothetical protein
MDFYVADSINNYRMFMLIFTTNAVLVDRFYVVDAVRIQEILSQGGVLLSIIS